MLRYGLAFVLITGLLIVGSLSIAQAGTKPNLPEYQGTLEQAVQAAIREQVTLPTDAALFVNPIAEYEQWYFGSVGVFPEHTLPDIYLFLAKQQRDTWAVAIEDTTHFATALRIIPRPLLTPEQWATLTSDQPITLAAGEVGTLQDDRGLAMGLPWPVGESRYLTQGPHAPGGSTLAALDFAGSPGARVHAARSGVVYHACPGAPDTYVRIDHGGGVETHYYHLDSISVPNGQWVSRWVPIGVQGTKVRCGGWVTGAHFQFWIKVNGQNLAIDGIDIGGWRVSGNCMVRIRDGLSRCVNSLIVNEGAIGTGYTIGQPSDRVEVFEQAYNRNGGAAKVGYPVGPVRWHGNTNRVMLQEFDGGELGALFIVLDRPSDEQVRGTPAYIIRGGIWHHYRHVLGAWDSWLGPPTSDEYINTDGKLQQNFRNGILIYHSSENVEARPWPTPVDGQWRIEYRNYVSNPSNVQMGPTWVRNGALYPVNSLCWGNGSPLDGKWGVWADYFTVRMSGRFYFEEGLYRFRARADDVINLYINQNPVIRDEDASQVNEEYVVDRYISAGYHNVLAEFTELTGHACLEFSWTKLPAPEPPSNLRQIGRTITSITLTWQDNSTDETGFYIYVQNGNTWNRIATLGANATTHTITDLQCGQSYTYRVSAYSNDGESAPSNTVTATTADCPPQPPSNLQQTGRTQTSITLTWQDNSTDETGFYIYVQNGNTWNRIATLGANATTHTITDLQCGQSYTYRVSAYSNDGESAPSNTVTATTADCTLFLFMLYLNGDNDLYRYIARALQSLERATANPNVKIVVLVDGDQNGDTQRLVFEATSIQRELLGELNMGNPQTLQEFVRWARDRYPARYSYLALAGHGNGLVGIGPDQNSGNDVLEPWEISQALRAATNNGQRKIDIVHYDACSMALLEHAYELRNYAGYLIASQYLAWSVFAYQNYAEQVTLQGVPMLESLNEAIAEVSAASTPRSLATQIAERYFGHAALIGSPRTISVLDLGHVESVMQALDQLLTLLQNNLQSVKTDLQRARQNVQKFDSREPLYKITQEDEYIDLVHWASLVQSIPNSSINAAAQQVLDRVRNQLVVVSRRESGNIDNLSINLDNANGVSIYFPLSSGGNAFQSYSSHRLFQFTANSQWDDFLNNYFTVTTLPIIDLGPAGLLPLLRPKDIVYVPLVVR
jgi:murein DD-endopeptidase MepM/ murein hydrolase activator NlpD